MATVTRGSNQPMPGSHPRARRVRPGEGSPAKTVPLTPPATAHASAPADPGKRRMSTRLVGEVKRINQDAPAQACMGCDSEASIHAETASGWLPLCAACLNKARRAQMNFDRTARSRAEVEREIQHNETFERRFVLSGGGANGTGRRR